VLTALETAALRLAEGQRLRAGFFLDATQFLQGFGFNSGIDKDRILHDGDCWRFPARSPSVAATARPFYEELRKPVVYPP